MTTDTLRQDKFAAVPVPDRISALPTIATDLSWSWSRYGTRMFAWIDPLLWTATGENPVALLRRVDAGRLEECAVNPDFLALYDAEVDRLSRMHRGDESWFGQRYPEVATRPVAYFCAEFAVHSSIPIYSGGLGILAGDHCKSASDLGIPLIGVGLLYNVGFFHQQIRSDGWQEDHDEAFDPADSPLEPLTSTIGDRSLAVVRMFDRDVHVGVWRMTVGGVSLYLLTTDLEQNHPDDRPITSKLYGGGNELRLRQEWILGVGGVRVLRALGIEPRAWHANEGHAAFMMVERLRELMARGVSGPDAVVEVRTHGIFTTHTPVAAGHDAFPEGDVAACAGPIWEEMGVSKDAVLALGRQPGIPDGRFHMTAAAIRLSGRVNGVAAKHGEVSRTLWQSMWPGKPVAEVPIGAVTNGVHLPTWMADELKALLDSHLGMGWKRRRDDPALWEQMLSLDPAALWRAHQALKHKLVASLRETARLRWSDAPLPGVPADTPGTPRDATNAERALGVATSGVLFDPEVFTIGFARRFATYKRADLIFRDLARVRALVTDPRRPVQIVFAGKAHPADSPGKKVLQNVYAFAKDPLLAGRIAFVEDYDMHIASRLVQGVDLWLNLPRVPLEASGTSGMKAALNGVPQLSTLDGWWPEAYDGKNGWAIPVAGSALGARTPAEQAALEQAADTADAANLYALLEQEVVPTFYDRGADGLPLAWLARMKHAIFIAGRFFTTRRMLQQYADEYYAPALRGQAPAGDPPNA